VGQSQHRKVCTLSVDLLAHLLIKIPNATDLYKSYLIILSISIATSTVSVNEERLPAGGENVEAVTTASALADAMLEVMNSLGEQQ